MVICDIKLKALRMSTCNMIFFTQGIDRKMQFLKNGYFSYKIKCIMDVRLYYHLI
jgi:hypothetical protein